MFTIVTLSNAIFPDIFVNGRLFEIAGSTKAHRESYFSDIAIFNSYIRVIGSKNSEHLYFDIPRLIIMYAKTVSRGCLLFMYVPPHRYHYQ